MATRKKASRPRPAARAAMRPVNLPIPTKVGVTGHLHGLPRCRGDQHHPSCRGKGAEITCNQVTIFGRRVCFCLHRKG